MDKGDSTEHEWERGAIILYTHSTNNQRAADSKETEKRSAMVESGLVVRVGQAGIRAYCCMHLPHDLMK